MNQSTPIHRFLGDVDLSLGPFGLLGLNVGPCDSPLIDAALKRQLGRIDRHPQRSSPDAEEVRLAIHVAAAQLRDRPVREEILADLSYRPTTAPRPPAPSETKPPLRPPASSSGLPGLARAAAQAVGVVTAARPSVGGDRRAFERMALWVLTDAGGWNRVAQRRIAALAHAWSLSTDELTASLSALSASAAARATRATLAQPPRADSARVAEDALELPEAPLPTRGPLRRWVLLGLLVVMVVSSALMIRGAFNINAARLRDAAALREREVVLPGLEGESTEPSPASAPPEPQPVVRDVALTRPAEQKTAPGSSAPGRPGLEPVADANTVEWAVFARAQLDRAAPAGAPLDEVLRDAARYAIVNTGAARLQRSETQATAEARRLITSLAADGALARADPADAASLAQLTSPAQPPDGRLALELLANKRNAAGAIEALKRLRVGRQTLGPADCDAVAEVALFSAGAELRGAARQVVIDEARNPAMLESVLDLMARNPPAAPASDMIQELARCALPPVGDASWPACARAALLARLAEEIGAERDSALDELAESLGASYEATAGALTPGREGAAPSPGVVDAAGSGALPSVGAGRVFGLWRDRAAVFRSDQSFDRRVEEAHTRRQQRLMLASGPVQRFIAEQGSVVEMMALVVAAERPSQASRVEALLAEFAAERRDAAHAMAQIRAGERAAARLWLALLNQADLSSPPKGGV